MYLTSSCSFSGERWRTMIMWSASQLSETRPRSFLWFASGRVLRPSVTSLLSSTCCAIRGDTGALVSLAAAARENPGDVRAIVAINRTTKFGAQERDAELCLDIVTLFSWRDFSE